jgi:hypothetical protein
MQFYAFILAKHGKSKKQHEVAALVGVSTETISRWKKINGFSEWLAHRLAIQAQPINDRLEFFALQNLADFRFWKEMAVKHRFLQPSLGEEESGYDFIYHNEFSLRKNEDGWGEAVIPKEYLEKIDQICQDQGISKDEVLERLFRQFLEAD